MSNMSATHTNTRIINNIGLSIGEDTYGGHVVRGSGGTFFLGSIDSKKNEEFVYVSETREMESLYDFHMQSSKAFWNETY